MYPPVEPNLNYETEDTIYFFTWPFYPLDNYSAHQILIWWRVFATVEHAYQWKKFSVEYPDIAEEIFNAKSPEQVKNISIKNHDKTPTSWHNEKVAIMKEILYSKTSQHEDVRDILLKTGNKNLAENSPIDAFWWIGPDGNGESMVGKIWVEIRENLRLL